MKKEIYEKLPKKEYEVLHKKYTKRGLRIPQGIEVKMTDWAKQNGIKQKKGRKYYKVRKSRKPDMIWVQPNGTNYSLMYWAGFWKRA